MIIGLVGMTATGKTEIAKCLEKYGLKKIVTTTTRPMRPGEIEGIDYDFISDKEFESIKSKNGFLETTSYNTVHGVWKYGTPINALKDDGVIILNPDGAKIIKELNQINSRLILIQASEGVIKNRLRFRKDTAEEAERRIAADKKDFRNINKIVDFSIRNEENMTPEIAAHIIFEIYKICKKEGK